MCAFGGKCEIEWTVIICSSSRCCLIQLVGQLFCVTHNTFVRDYPLFGRIQFHYILLLLQTISPHSYQYGDVRSQQSLQYWPPYLKTLFRWSWVKLRDQSLSIRVKLDWNAMTAAAWDHIANLDVRFFLFALAPNEHAGQRLQRMQRIVEMTSCLEIDVSNSHRPYK